MLDQPALIPQSLAEREPFVRGYALVHEAVPAEPTEGWRRTPLGDGYDLRSQSRTEVAAASCLGTAIVLIGRAFDLSDGVRDTHVIAQRILEKFEGGFDAALRYASYLGGRHAIFLHTGGRIIAMPDCHATYAILASAGDHGVLFCSHWTLGADILDLPRNMEAAEFMNSPAYASPMGKYYPALWGPCLGLSHVFPNCFAVYDTASGTLSHQRFYPFAALEAQSPDAVYPQFVDLMRRSVALSSEPGAALSLTAGGDSRAVLAAATMSGGLPDDAFAFSYARFSDRHQGAIEDVLGASRAAFAARIRHLVLDLAPPDMACEFHQFYARSFRLGARYAALARLYYESLPHDITILISTVAETGTVFYKERDSDVPTPAALAAKFTTSAARSSPDLIRAFEDYQSWTQFDAGRIFNFDWHDLFYWEHRNAKWASVWYAEADLTGFAIVPYNNRRLIELMLSLPEEHRRSRYLQKRLIAQAGL
jgi:asparagine synthase (glutamine-hydrolysing)